MNYSHNITFITSYIKIYDEEYDLDKVFDKRLEYFLKLAETGINICIFTSHEFKNIFENICNKYRNIRLIEIISIEELYFSKKNFSELIELCELPQIRCQKKDNHNYMYLMNSKIEFVKKTIDINPFSTDYFSWFDFSLPYIFRNLDQTIENIRILSQRNYIKTFLAMPGCWNHKITDINHIKYFTTWRFCGGFFLGDKQSLISFYNLSINNFKEFLEETKTLLWEVNYWAWLESNKNFNPIWYIADHNDSIIDIPQEVYTVQVFEYSKKFIIYDYPEQFFTYENNEIKSQLILFPSSASYVYDFIFNKHILNTRYVNYYYNDNWDCDFYNDQRIFSINISSELDDNFIPKSYNYINVEEINIKNNQNALYQGLEDIRLFIHNDKVKFIASNMSYMDDNKIRIITGDYDYNNNICKNCKIVNMLWDFKCEKNWSPIQDINNKQQLFIYKWSPYQIGFVDDNNNFQLYFEKNFNNQIINKFRGSTIFFEYNIDYYIGLVHYSVKNVPPIYYNCLVLIDKKTLIPFKYSDPFKFSDKPIEFCIGFTIQLNEYLFWVSQMDREPVFLKIDINKIPILNRCE